MSKLKKHPNIKPPAKIFGNIWVIKCLDYVDSTNSEVFDEAVASLLRQGHYRILLDFSELNFITSDVPNTLISYVGKARDDGGDILLLNPTHNVMDIIELLGLAEIFNIAMDSGSAMHYFKNLEKMPRSHDTQELPSIEPPGR